MKGSIHYRGDCGWWFILWYDPIKKSGIQITKYKGERMWDKRLAQKLLAQMQGDWENGTFRIEKYKESWTDVIPYLDNWLKTIKSNISPATYKDYKNSLENHLKPFFRVRNIQLHEIQYDVLCELSESINRAGKGKKNVLYALHACLDFAWRSRRIPALPPFPRIKVQEPAIEWLPEERQIKIIKAIPEEHQPIYWFLKYHLRRPGEAMALKWEDYDERNQCVIIRRSISARRVVEKTKTGKIHIVPLHSAFRLPAKTFSPYIFVNKSSHLKDKRYSHGILSKLWKTACVAVGESPIRLYAGLKHSGVSQFINEKGYSLEQVQAITDHARLESLKRYAKTEVARKRALLEGKIVELDVFKNKKTENS